MYEHKIFLYNCITSNGNIQYLLFAKRILNRRSKKILRKDVRKLKESIYKSYDELPLFLNAGTIAKVLGIANSTAYELMHENDFPALKIGNRLIVPKEKFKLWIDSKIKNNNK